LYLRAIGIFFSAAVHLEAEEAARAQRVVQVRAEDAVEIGFDVIADGFDAEMVPIIGPGDFAIERRECFSVRAGGAVIGLDVAATALFIVDAAGEGFAFEVGVDFDLVTVNIALADVYLLTLPFIRHRLVGVGAADLQAAVHARVHFEIEFEDEIIVVLFGEEKAVRAGAGNVHLANDAAVLDEVGGVAGFLRPAGEVFAVEQINPSIFGEDLLGGDEGDCEECFFEVSHKRSVGVDGEGRKKVSARFRGRRREGERGRKRAKHF